MKKYISIDIGGTAIKYGLIDDKANILENYERKTNAQKGGDHILNEVLKIVENFGIEIDLHKGAIRKTILAFQPEEYINYYLKKDLSNYLDAPVNKDALRKDLMEIRNKKISVSDSEYIEDAIGIGAPVFNYKDNLVGAIGVVIPKERVTEATKKEYIEAVKNCGIEFSKNLGYSEA